jgi:hypothetical protein
MKLVMVAITAASFAAPINANAAELRSVACSVSVNYLVDSVVRAPYQKDFVITPGVVFEDDFSSRIRFRFLDAWTRLEADNKTTTVSISYYNDIGVFEYIDFNTDLKLRDDQAPATTSGTSRYYTEIGIAGEHTTSWTLTCQVLKN